MALNAQDIRNLVMVGHGHSGKTAVLDAIAYHTKITTRHGDSADGTSISNTEPEEKERKQTLQAHLFAMPVGSATLNVIDVPGHADFQADSLAALRVVETACLCVSADGPVPFHARQLWKAAADAGVARAILVTHLDHDNTSFDDKVEELRAVFGHSVVPVTYADGSSAAFTAVHSVVKGEGPKASTYHEMIEEEVAEVDDALMERYLENGKLTAEEFDQNLGRAMVAGALVPVFAICPPKMIGVEEFLDFAVRYFPSPAAFGPRNAGKPGSDSFADLVEPDPDGPFAAKVYRVVSDPYVGKLSFMRCYRGTLKVEQSVLNVDSGKVHKVAHILVVQGHEQKEVPEVGPGCLFAVSKIEDFQLGNAVTAEGAPLTFPKVQFPDPTYAQHIWPKSRGDEQKIGQALEKLAAEDPTFRTSRDKDTGELIASGMSPLHLEVQFLRMRRRYQVEVEHGMPTIPYRETITQKAEGHHRHKKQSGGRGQFGEVYLRVAPKGPGEGFEFIDSVVGGAIPRQFIPETEKGIRKFLQRGGLAGFPVVDVSAEVYDGKAHDVDSDQLSFQLAGERAFADGYAKARPILLEPIMDVEIHVPERFTGEVAGSLSSIRGRMSGMEARDGIQHIRAQVPMASMLDYTTQLRSITAGEGTFTMKFAAYEPVPPNVQAEVVARRKKLLEEQKEH
ncbi:MAG: elongation factor G [Planctomycetota bacterium]